MTEVTHHRSVRAAAKGQPQVDDDDLRALLDHLGRLLAQEYVDLLKRPLSDVEGALAAGDE